MAQPSGRLPSAEGPPPSAQTQGSYAIPVASQTWYETHP